MRIKCTTSKVAGFFVDNIITDGGEGIIMRENKSLYFRGRSDSLWKLKVK